MGKITKIAKNSQGDRVFVYIDGEYCMSVRERTFKAMGLRIGERISCAELKERENFFWKQAYGQASWEAEKVRLNKVAEFIGNVNPRLIVETIGFGADSTDYIEAHPENSGVPDLRVLDAESGKVICLVEVTGTLQRRGKTFWVRPDKISYAQSSDIPVWIAVHYQKPFEFMRFIKPQASISYLVSSIEIRKATEHYVEFVEDAPEVVTPSEIAVWLKEALP